MPSRKSILVTRAVMALLNKEMDLGCPRQTSRLHIALSCLLIFKKLITFLLSAASCGWSLYKSFHFPLGPVLPCQEDMRVLLVMSRWRMMKDEVVYPDYRSSANEDHGKQEKMAMGRIELSCLVVIFIG